MKNILVFAAITLFVPLQVSCNQDTDLVNPRDSADMVGDPIDATPELTCQGKVFKALAGDYFIYRARLGILKGEIFSITGDPIRTLQVSSSHKGEVANGTYKPDCSTANLRIIGTYDQDNCPHHIVLERNDNHPDNYDSSCDDLSNPNSQQQCADYSHDMYKRHILITVDHDPQECSSGHLYFHGSGKTQHPGVAHGGGGGDD